MADNRVSNAKSTGDIPTKKNEVVIDKERVNRILLGRNSQLFEVSTEESLSASDVDLLKRHNKSFADLLSNYVASSDKSQKQKRGMKIAFFSIIMFIITVLCLSFAGAIFLGIYMQGKEKINASDLIAPIVASFASVVTSILVLPKIIAEYLFDKSEDDRLSKMVSNMQEYDKELRNHRNTK